jgi:hypothetical protein
VLGQGWARAGTVKSKNMINVFKTTYLLRFWLLGIEVGHQLEKETGVVQKGRW